MRSCAGRRRAAGRDLGLLDPPGGDGQGRSKRQRPSLGKRVKVRKREGVQFYVENCTVSLPNVHTA